MPVGDVLVSDPGGDVEHDDGTLALDVVTVAQTAELLLDIKMYRTTPLNPL